MDENEFDKNFAKRASSPFKWPYVKLLEHSEALQKAADYHWDDLAENQMISHIGSNCLGLYDRLKMYSEGYKPGLASELIVPYNTSNPVEILLVLVMKYHRELLDPNFNYIGASIRQSSSSHKNAVAVVTLINEFIETIRPFDDSYSKNSKNNDNAKNRFKKSVPDENSFDRFQKRLSLMNYQNLDSHKQPFASIGQN